MAESKKEGTVASNRPLDTALRQQRLKGWQPVLDPLWVVAFMILLGVIFIPVGVLLQQKSEEIVELSLEYDNYQNSSQSLCGSGKTPNQNKTCTLPSITVPKDMQPPILVYYQLTNFYQNHFKYKESVDINQLKGEPSQKSTTKDHPCTPLYNISGTLLNPCGLVANTFFNDIIKLVDSKDANTSEPLQMREDGIAWQSELEYRFDQPIGFQHEQCTSCDADDCTCEGDNWSCKEPWKDPEDGSCYKYFYPDDDITQYLYETYPMVINPIEGVTNEHFIVWMRLAALPKFRKLYGYIQQPIAKGTELTFEVTANFEVESFAGTKTLVITTANEFGGKNDYFGRSFIIVGALNIVFAFLFGVKHWLAPRKLGDPLYLKYKEA